MLIDKNLCDKCGECQSECPQRAIIKDGAGGYAIDAGLCDDCKSLGDIECIRMCAAGAIRFGDGTLPAFDKMWRVRPEHVIWTMALMGSRGAQAPGKYQVGSPGWDWYRKLASDAFLDPDLKMRIVRSFDDICIKCPAKQEPGHAEVSGKVDDLCFKELGIGPGGVMRFWDMVKLIEEKCSVPFIRTLTPIPDDIFGDFLCFLSPGAAALRDM
jgi:ferredoxin